MPPPVQKSGIDDSAILTRSLTRNTSTPGGPGDIVRITLPRLGAFHIVSRTAGFCAEDGTVCIYYHSTSARTDAGGIVVIDDVRLIQSTNNMPGAIVTPAEDSEFFVIKVDGNGSGAPAYWTCEVSIVQAMVP